MQTLIFTLVCKTLFCFESPEHAFKTLRKDSNTAQLCNSPMFADLHTWVSARRRWGGTLAETQCCSSPAGSIPAPRPPWWLWPPGTTHSPPCWSLMDKKEKVDPSLKLNIKKSVSSQKCGPFRQSFTMKIFKILKFYKNMVLFLKFAIWVSFCFLLLIFHYFVVKTG